MGRGEVQTLRSGARQRLHLGRRLGDGRREHLAAACRAQHVVFDADAAEAAAPVGVEELLGARNSGPRMSSGTKYTPGSMVKVIPSASGMSMRRFRVPN
jgi:hypothetical protein